MSYEPERVLFLVSGAIMILLAPVLLWLNPRDRANRAFSTVLLLTGLFAVGHNLAVASADPGTSTRFMMLGAGSLVGVIFASAYFASVYPRPRPWLPKGALGPALFALPAVVLVGALSLVPGAMPPPETITSRTVVDSFLRGHDPGKSVSLLWHIVYLVIALVFVRDYLRIPEGRRRSTLFLVGLGFFTPAACTCAVFRFAWRFRAGNFSWNEAGGIAEATSLHVMEDAFLIVWAVALLALLGYLRVAAVRSRDRDTYRQLRLFLFVALASTALGVGFALFMDPRSGSEATLAAYSLLSLLGLLLVSYAVVRYRLFDIDVKVKLALTRSTVLGSFVAVFFAVTEAVQYLFADVTGSAFFGIGAAASLVLFQTPLKRMAEGIADAAMPSTTPLSALDPAECRYFYREHVELLWMDGTITPKDRLVLTSLRDRLGLTPEAAEEIEFAVIGVEG